jgi:hypothetical protein
MLLGLAVAVLATTSLVAAVLPAPGRTTGGWTLADRLALVGFAILVVAGLALLARPRVRADAYGLEVVNVRRRHRLAWAQVVGVRLSRHDPWLVLDLDDGTTLNAMGVQNADGARARSAAREIAGLLAARMPTPNDD